MFFPTSVAVVEKPGTARTLAAPGSSAQAQTGTSTLRLEELMGAPGKAAAQSIPVEQVGTAAAERLDRLGIRWGAAVLLAGCPFSGIIKVSLIPMKPAASTHYP